MAAEMSDPTTRLSREQIEKLRDHYTPYRSFQDSEEDREVRQLADDALAYRAALDEVRSNHTPNIRGPEWCELYSQVVRQRNCPICEVDGLA